MTLSPTGESEKVEACPVCGDDGVVSWQPANLGGIRGAIECIRCRMLGPESDVRAEAVSSWNSVARAVKSAEKWRDLAREAYEGWYGGFEWRTRIEALERTTDGS